MNDVTPEVEKLPDAPAPEPVAAPAAPEKPVSVREAVKSAFDKQKEPVAEPAPEAPKDAKEAKPATDAPEAKAEKGPRIDQIPVGWKGGAAAWHALAPDAKEYIARRNSEYSQGIQQHAVAAKFANDMASVFRPYEGMLRSRGANPIGAAQYLMDGYAQLIGGTPQQKQAILLNLAREAGVDLGTIQAELPQVDPQVATLQQQIAQIASQLQNQQQSAQSAESAHYQAQIDAFRADPAHPHFEAVKEPMAALLMVAAQKGREMTLKEAYDEACWSLPDVRASLVNQHLAQEAEKRKAQVQAAQNAAVSVTGAPPAPVTEGGDLSIRSILKREFAKSGPRV